jgi:hypothetical protein
VFDQKAIEFSVDPSEQKRKNKLKPAGAWHVVLALTRKKECANTEMKSIGCSQAIRGRCTSCC